jgi:FAD:protein FMN transferase
MPESDMHFALPGVHRFSHEAMATSFEIFICHADKQYAAKAAQEAFNELDRLEQQLSRFIPNSDIARLNIDGAKNAIVLGQAAFECLEISREIWNQTNGAFDITAGVLKDSQTRADRMQVGMDLLEMDQKTFSAKLKAEGAVVDLGAIGKGYAVDKLAEMLRKWEIEAALINGGRSSVLTFGNAPGQTGWQVSISYPEGGEIAMLVLKDCSLSGSGLQKGEHIISPRTCTPLKGNKAAWVLASDAARADAISTAFMVMEEKEIELYCQQHKDVRGVVLEDKNLKWFGKWENIIS